MEGKATGRPRRWASAVRRRRSSRLAATPPETRISARAEGFGGGKGLAHKIADNRGLERGDQVERLLVAEAGCMSGSKFRGCGQRSAANFDACRHLVRLHVAQNRGLDAAEGEIEAPGVLFALNLGEIEADGRGISVCGERVHPWAAGVAKTE